MALYNFHRVLIASAILFDFGFSLYCFRRYQITGEGLQLTMLVASSVVTVAMIGYLIHFNKGLVVFQRQGALTCGDCGYNLETTMAAGRTACPECGAAIPTGFA
ncbi:MAG: hypothetical protein CMJ18_23300 [Phycisphaeraceae bacterium]|nr:hypothetical protein [Phycisphaeraceae bacterium]